MNLHHCHINEEAIVAAERVLRFNRISQGEEVQRFEDALTQQLDLRNPVAVNSGTSAIHLALVLAGVGPADEVILPAQTFIATGMAVLMCGAEPVFADIDPLTGNLNPEMIYPRITSRTKAILCVHWAGLPCDLFSLGICANQYNIPVIEDAAHAFGATYEGQPIGNYSRFTCFSFQAIKHLTTGDGGALCCFNHHDWQAAIRGRWFGIDRNEPFGPLGEREGLVHHLGFKYHMNDLAAAVGLGNLIGFKERLARRRENDRRYRLAFQGFSGIVLLRQDSMNRESACWVFSLLAERRDDFILALKSRGIPASVINRRIDRHPVFGGLTEGLHGQEQFERMHVALPCHDALTEEDVSKVIAAVKAGW